MAITCDSRPCDRLISIKLGLFLSLEAITFFVLSKTVVPLTRTCLALHKQKTEEADLSLSDLRKIALETGHEILH